MERPHCPDPAHAGGRVVRAGWYGTSPHRRQRWKCEPPNGDPAHRFAEVLPRREAPADCCLECSTLLERWEGQPGARQYSFNSREVAHALKLIAGGNSYRAAAGETRLMAKRKRLPRPKSFRSRSLRRDPNVDGQIVANWVDAYAPTLMEELPAEWPEIVLVDSINFRIATGIKAGLGYHIFVAVAYEPVPGTFMRRPVVHHIQASPRKDAAAWREFFHSLGGTPRMIVTDMDASIRQAARQVFPRAGAPAPDFRMCEWHLKRSIETNLAILAGQPQHPIWGALKKAFYSDQHWDAFEQEVAKQHAAGGPRLAAMTRWLNKNAKHVRAQMATRSAAGPHSIGAVESTLQWIARAFDNKRSSVFGNRRRMNLLLGLMTLELRGQANELAWAEQIRSSLLPARGVPQAQRPHDDRYLTPSLIW